MMTEVIRINCLSEGDNFILHNHRYFVVKKDEWKIFYTYDKKYAGSKSCLSDVGAHSQQYVEKILSED